MTGRSRACRPTPALQTDTVVVAVAAPSQRYDIAINGTYLRTVGGDVAETMFRRWSQRPDVVVRGDLRSGFFWKWPDPESTRFEFVPEGGQGSGNFTDDAVQPTSAETGHPQHKAVAA